MFRTPGDGPRISTSEIVGIPVGVDVDIIRFFHKNVQFIFQIRNECLGGSKFYIRVESINGSDMIVQENRLLSRLVTESGAEILLCEGIRNGSYKDPQVVPIKDVEVNQYRKDIPVGIFAIVIDSNGFATWQFGNLPDSLRIHPAINYIEEEDINYYLIQASSLSVAFSPELGFFSR